MMKHSFAINVGAAIVLLVPAVALQGGGASSLDESLRKTIAVLDELAGIEQRLASKDASAVQDVLRLTEPPVGTDAERDRRRDQLRDEIQELQSRRDALGAPRAGEIPDAEGAPVTATAPRVRVGAAPHAASATRAPASFETHGYVADTARLVRAYYKQGRYGEALAVLGPDGVDASSNYWKGRCLERLGRREEALAAYRVARDAQGGGADAERAKEAVAFLEWQIAFEARRAEVQTP